MPILTLQKRARELGRIRIGKKGDRGQPQKLDRFRVTSASQNLIEKVAELYGGTATPWDNGGVAQWEVLTDARRIPIMVPPQPVSQWLETWAGGSKGCVHRCDGETNYLTGDPCDPDDPDHINAKPTTRLNVVLRDVEGIGVFRLESHGWNAAVELPDMAAFLAQAGGYVNGWLSLEERVSKSEGQTRRFIVPLIEIDVTPAQLMAGKGRVETPSMESPVERPALAAAGPDPYAEYHGRLQEAMSVEDLRGIWTDAVAEHIVGTSSTASPARTAFFEAYEAKAKELKAATPAAAAEPRPNEDGTYDADVVDDPADGGDADAVWQQILAAGHNKHGWKLAQVQDDFTERMQGLLPSDATAGELRVYLEKLQADEDTPAVAS